MLLRWHGCVATGMRRCSLALTQLGYSGRGSQITHMSWVTMEDSVHLEHYILDSRYHSALWIKQLLNQSCIICFVTCALWSDQYRGQWLFFLFRVLWLISRAAFVEVPLSIRKHQPDDEDTVCEILVALNLRHFRSSRFYWILLHCLLFSVVYSVAVVA